MTGIGIRSQEMREAEFEETEQRKPVAELASKDQIQKKRNKTVKLAMAEELIQMGISRSSAYRILNIRKNISKKIDIPKVLEINEKK